MIRNAIAIVVAGMLAVAASAPAAGQTAVSPSPGAVAGAVADSAAVVSYEGAPLREVLGDVRRRTGVEFLYRDALVAGVRISLQAEDAALLDALGDAVRRHGLRLEVDAARKQGLLTKATAPAQAPPVLTGQVVDAETGARLPLATVTWPGGDGRRRGVAADESGAFRIRLSDALRQRDTLALTASYVGYAAQTVRIDPSRPPADLPLRLRPSRTTAPEVVVQSLSLQSDLDTTWQSLLQPERFAPLGESSLVSSVQTLPSVSLTPVLSGGLNVRGSRDDGFHVLLDGMSIYNQTHLFGLFDAFNAEALQTVGFFYGVAPADYPAPPGGTMAFQTRTGSQSEFRASAGASSTAVSATVEGPLAGGQGSWLVSARHSTLGIGWLGNDDLISTGLDVDRPREPLPGAADELEELLFLPDPPSARFFDVHATALWESDDRHRWTLSTYAGGDDAAQSGRRVSVDETPTRRERLQRDILDTTAVATDNRWGNLGASLQWQAPLGDRAVSHATAAVSRYHSRFDTDTFLYVRFRQEENDRGLESFRAPFLHDNELVETSLRHRLTVQPSHPGTWTGGYAVRFYDLTYTERSATAPTFDGTQQSVQADAFAQYDVATPVADLHAGLRLHHFSKGSYTRVSPRLQMRFAPDRPLSAGLGYSRNHQFLHRLELQGDVSSPVWVPSTEAQPPGSVDHLTAGVYAHPTAATAVQVEGYWKIQRNLRLHDTRTRLRGPDDSVLMDPWTADNDALARGVELLVQQRAGAVTWTGAYTLSRVDVNPSGGDGREPAEWDRRHQVTTRLVWNGSEHVSAHATWAFATGTPNPYAELLPRREADRLDSYHRLDLGASVRGTLAAAEWSARLALFNAYDRNNPWYRTPIGVLRPDGPDPNSFRDLGFVLVDVYDLGLRPSFSISVRWP
jgi:hypothetical protein